LKAQLEDQAEWRRRKAIEYPDDRRNLDAAEEYERLAKTVQAIPDDLLVAYSEAFEGAPDSERFEEMLKDIFRGFFDPTDATELVRSFLDRKREEEDEFTINHSVTARDETGPLPPDDLTRSLTVLDHRRPEASASFYCRRHLYDSYFRQSDRRALLPDRHARTERRRAAAPSPRFRGDVHNSRR
jgi:hypothetical protein